MSHIIESRVAIKNLAAVRAAAKELGFEVLDKKTFRWYGGEQPCELAIRVPGASYEYGIIKQQDGKSYQLAYDSWSSYGKALEENKQRFLQLIGVHTAEQEARRLRMTARRIKLNDGTIRLVVTQR